MEVASKETPGMVLIHVAEIEEHRNGASHGSIKA